MVRKFIAYNRAACDKLERFLPQAKNDIFRLYETTVAEYMNSAPDMLVVDVGGGRTCPFARRRNPDSNPRIIAVDSSPQELRENDQVDETMVADITRGLPFQDASVDMVVSRSVLEHLEDIESFVADSRRVLKDRGYFIHLFPSRFAPFSLLNQALPNRVARGLLFSLLPETKGIGGFPARYRKCYYDAVRRLVEENGFEVISLLASYYQSPYFGFFLPLYVLSALYEMLIRAARARNLCAYLLLVARKKPGAGGGPAPAPSGSGSTGH